MTPEEQCDRALRIVENDLTIMKAVKLLKELGYDWEGAILVLAVFWEKP